MIAKTSLFWQSHLWQKYISPCLLVIIALCAYAPSLKYPFLFDDYPNIIKSLSIKTKSLSDLIFSNTRWISTWLNTLYYSAVRFDPFLYRLGNICFHILTGLIIFYTFFCLFKHSQQAFIAKYAYNIAFTAALLFILHPVQTQTISYITQGQLEGLAALFIMSIIACFISATYAKNIYKQIGSVILLFLLGLFSSGTKEIAIISPLLLLLIDWFFIAQGSWSKFKKRLFFHIVFSSYIIGIYIYLLKPDFFSKLFSFQYITYNNVGNALTHEAFISPYYYCISQLKVIMHYIFIFFWPFAISVDYDWKLCSSFWNFTCIIPALFLCILCFFCLRRLYNNTIDFISFGLLWFFIAILPRSSIIPSSELVADYKTYLASYGLLLIGSYIFVYLAVYLNKLLEKHAIFMLSAYRAPIAVFSLSILLGWTSYTQNIMWSSGEALWQRAIKYAPDKARVWNNYAVERLSALLKQDNLSQDNSPTEAFDELINLFEKAITLDSQYFQAMNNLAFVYFKKGQLDQAIDLINKSLEINSLYPESYNNLGSFLYHKQEYTQAQEALEKAIALHPTYGKALFLLAKVMQAQNNMVLAQKYFKQACIQADYDTLEGFKLYGLTSIALNNFEDAVDAFERALKLEPHMPQIMFELATCYFALKNYKKALELFTELSHRIDADVSIFYNLAQTYSKLKDYKNAYNNYKKAQEHDTSIAVIYLKIAKCLHKIGKKETAHTYLTNFIDQNPPALFRYKAMAYRKKLSLDK